jgi:hypothetical protein
MQLSLFGYAVILFIAASFLGGLVAAVVAWRRKTLFFPDVGTVLLAPALFYILGSLRPEFRIGWGMILWPFITLVFGFVLFGLRVSVFDHLFQNPLRNSVVLCLMYLAFAVLGGFGMPAWYD